MTKTNFEVHENVVLKQKKEEATISFKEIQATIENDIIPVKER